MYKDIELLKIVLLSNDLKEVEIITKWDSPILPSIGHEIDINLFSPQDNFVRGNYTDLEEYKKLTWIIESISWTRTGGSVATILKVVGKIKDDFKRMATLHV